MRQLLPLRRAHRVAVVFAAGLMLLLVAGCRPSETRTAEGKADGRKLYLQHCAGCHGEDGRRGDPETHAANAARMSEDAVRAVILNGKGQTMPAWKDRLEPDEINAVVEYVRGLGR